MVSPQSVSYGKFISRFVYYNIIIQFYALNVKHFFHDIQGKMTFFLDKMTYVAKFSA